MQIAEERKCVERMSNRNLCKIDESKLIAWRDEIYDSLLFLNDEQKFSDNI